MKRNLTNLEILDFAEGLPLDHETEELMVVMLSGSPEFRRDLEDYRRELAQVDALIPSFPLTLELAQQLPQILRAALKKRHEKEMSPEKFFRSREVALVLGFLVAMLALVILYVWIWQRN